MASANDRTPERPYGGVSAEERVARRRERLLDAAIELYGTAGYVSTGVKEICNQAGLTERYFYESFANSEELFTAAFDRAADELLGIVARSVAEVDPNPQAQAQAAIEGFVRALADDRRVARILFTERASAGAEIERHMRSTVRRFSALVGETARQHLPAGTPERLITMGSLSLVGAIEQVIIEWQEGQLDVSIDEIVAYLVQLFLMAGAIAGVEPDSTGASPERR